MSRESIVTHRSPANVDRELLTDKSERRKNTEFCKDLCTKVKYQQVEPPSLSTPATYTNSSECETFLQSPAYKEAITKARIPFLHHYILECGHAGVIYTFEDHDITLIVPEGALAKDQIVHFELDATMYGPFIFPKNACPISPIVWLSLLEKDVKLKKSFQLILPHFLTELTKEELYHHRVGYAKAIRIIKDGEIKYEFGPWNSELRFASCGNKNFAVLESDHCCFYCLEANITRKLAKDAGYCLTQVERSVSHNKYEISFIATYFLQTCIQAIKEQFQDGYRISHHDNFKFEDEMVKFTHEPPSTDQHLIALKPSTAQIRVSDIDFWSTPPDQMRLKHDYKMYPPRVMMTVTLVNTAALFKLNVKVTGCSSESQLDRDITFPLESETVHSTSAVAQLKPSSHTVVTKDDQPQLKDAFRMLLPLAAHWRNIGVLLGINNDDLHTVNRSYTKEDDRLREMLSLWLKVENPLPTWSTLADAVEYYDPAIAKKIRDSIAK